MSAHQYEAQSLQIYKLKSFSNKLYKVKKKKLFEATELENSVTLK